MEGLASMLARAAENRRRLEARRNAQQAQITSAAPRSTPTIRHGAYTALMRSHDRVHSRHVNGKGGTDGA